MLAWPAAEPLLSSSNYTACAVKIADENENCDKTRAPAETRVSAIDS